MMDEYGQLTVAIDKESAQRASTGRQPRKPPHSEVKRSDRGTGSSKVSLEESWEDVVGGRLGFRQLPVRSPADILKVRMEAAILEGQLLTLSEPDMVTLNVEYFIVS